jgi:signal transduction histidine kinase
MAIIFLIDASTKVGVVGSMLYVIPVVACFWSPYRRTMLVVAAVASVLTVVAIPLKPPGETLFVIINRPISIFVIWVIVYIGFRLKKADEALRDNEAKYHGLFNTVKETIYVTRLVFDKDGKVIDWVNEDANPAGLEVFGLRSLDELKGRKGSETLGPEGIKFFVPKIEEARRTGKAVDFEYHSELTQRDFVSSLVVIGDTFVSSQRDVTDIKNAQRRAEEEHEHLRTILDLIPIGVFITDRDGNTVIYNKALDAIWGNAPHPSSVAEYRQYIGWYADTGVRLKADEWPAARAVQKGESSTMVVDIQRFDGTRGSMVASGVPLRDTEGKITGSAVAAQDVTELRNAEKELARSNDDLQQFAYLASHDLQEPLRMVTNYLELLERRYDGKLDKEATEYIDFAVEGAQRMRALIDDLLAYSRVETTPRPFSPVDMKAVVEVALKQLSTLVDESGAQIDVADLPTIMADDWQMTQVMQNLIGNAIKFHGAERPRIAISCAQNAREWTFAVRDNGIGLNMAYSDKLFHMFHRLHTREQYPGTGVGLALARKMVERHGGRIWVESEEGKGSTFFFTVPKIETGAPAK